MNSIVIGTRGEGKSTLALWLANQTHAAVIVFDPRAMYGGHVVESSDELIDALDSHLYEDGEPIVYQFDAEPEVAFADMASVLFPPRSEGERGGFALIVDEAGELQGPNTILPELRLAVARHPLEGDLRVHIIQTTHRLAEYSGKTKTVFDHLYIFRTQNPRDLSMLVDFTDSPELVDIVRNLPPHHLVHYAASRREDGRPQWELWDDPGVWFVPMVPFENRATTGVIQ